MDLKSAENHGGCNSDEQTYAVPHRSSYLDPNVAKTCYSWREALVYLILLAAAALRAFIIYSYVICDSLSHTVQLIHGRIFPASSSSRSYAGCG